MVLPPAPGEAGTVCVASDAPVLSLQALLFAAMVVDLFLAVLHLLILLGKTGAGYSSSVLCSCCPGQ